jgi:hypothetical protein
MKDSCEFSEDEVMQTLALLEDARAMLVITDKGMTLQGDSEALERGLAMALDTVSFASLVAGALQLLKDEGGQQ